ncbi:hypothetical protein BJV82DRAFT_662647 [Fennellomyces sp. T-0311]|nr:hypothetical protein BJV82DRAFT_662647 [Fennellomyces sp. T-0311]
MPPKKRSTIQSWWAKPPSSRLSLEEQEQRDLERALALSQEQQVNEQRAEYERLANRVHNLSPLKRHRHEIEPAVGGSADDSFETLTHRLVKKEKLSPKAEQAEAKQEKEEEEIVFDLDDIGKWVEDDDDDPLASSPPSPHFHEFYSKDSNERSDFTPDRQHLSDHKDDDEPDVVLYAAEECQNQNLDGIDSYSTSPSARERFRKPDPPTVQELAKRKSAKSMAAGVKKEQARHKGKDTGPRRTFNHYAVHDVDLEEQFDTAGFGGNVSGLSWEGRGQSRYQ